MTREETARILDPETSRDELWKYEADTRIEACNEACRMGADALRAQKERENPNPITNADRIRAMSDEELAKFLSGIAYARNTLWCEPFAEKFCKSCPTTTCTIEGCSHPMELHECDFTDGKCPHGSDIVWWLQQPAEED